jgi:hypothetical protein
MAKLLLLFLVVAVVVVVVVVVVNMSMTRSGATKILIAAVMMYFNSAFIVNVLVK